MELLKCLILSSVIMVSVINLDATERSVSFPSYSILVKDGDLSSKNQRSEFRIVNVSASSRQTAISCELNFLKNVKSEFYIDRSCSLIYHTADSVAKSPITAADGIRIHTRSETHLRNKSKYKRGDKLEFTLYFDPLPEDVDSFDLIEDLFSNWNRVDISLTDGAASREEQRIGACPYGDVIKEVTFMGLDKSIFSKWVSAHLHYPKELQLSNKEGVVTFEITIDTDGVLSFQIIEASLTAFNAEATRVLASSPKWTPATIRGRPVKCTLTFPVVFQLKRDMSNNSSVPL